MKFSDYKYFIISGNINKRRIKREKERERPVK